MGLFVREFVGSIDGDNDVLSLGPLDRDGEALVPLLGGEEGNEDGSVDSFNVGLRDGTFVRVPVGERDRLTVKVGEREGRPLVVCAGPTDGKLDGHCDPLLLGAFDREGKALDWSLGPTVGPVSADGDMDPPTGGSWDRPLEGPADAGTEDGTPLGGSERTSVGLLDGVNEEIGVGAFDTDDGGALERRLGGPDWVLVGTTETVELGLCEGCVDEISVSSVDGYCETVGTVETLGIIECNTVGVADGADGGTILGAVEAEGASLGSTLGAWDGSLVGEDDVVALGL